jgi:uncharacterized phage protein (TIGR02220 family)
LKPPAFQFYADDFIGGTVTMTNEERGLYIMCLCLQWTQGALDDADITYLSCGMSNPSVERVKRKFDRGEDGRLRNARLESERLKQAAWREKCKIGGKNSGESRKGSSRVVQLPHEVTPQLNANTPLSTFHSPPSDLLIPSNTLSGKPDVVHVKKPRGHHPHTEATLDYLNQRAGRKFRRVPPNLATISARLSEPDVTLDGVMAMIDRQVTRWAGTTMAEYLRPETLFSKTKFDSYYAAKDEPVLFNDDKGKPQMSALDRIMKGL